MHGHRSLPTLGEMNETFLSDGHLWIQEYVVGGLLRFRMDPSGLLHFGDSTTEFDAEAIPPHYRSGVEAVRRDIDRDRLRDGVNAVDEYTFFGVVPLRDGVEYGWAELPAFLGHDIWDGKSEGFTAEDVTERVFTAIGLKTVPTFEKEVPARHFEPTTYPFPESAFMEEAVPGVVVRKKHGQPAVHVRSDWTGRSSDQRPEPSDTEPLDDWAERVITVEYIQSLLEGSAETVWDQSVEELVASAATALARREFGTVGSQVESRPEKYERTVRNRIEELRVNIDR